MTSLAYDAPPPTAGSWVQWSGGISSALMILTNTFGSWTVARSSRMLRTCGANRRLSPCDDDRLEALGNSRVPRLNDCFEICRGNRKRLFDEDVPPPAQFLDDVLGVGIRASGNDKGFGVRIIERGGSVRRCNRKEGG
jgi:hypothetical protein